MALTKISTQFINTNGDGSAGQVLTADENGVFNWVNSTALEVSAGNISGTVEAAQIADTISASAQPNITSVGTLVTLEVAGDANVGNISATNAVFTSISGNGNGITTIAGANVTGAVANATYATTAGTANAVAGANVSGAVSSANTAATVTTNAQPNITSTGTLTSLTVGGNAIIGGNLTVNGTVTAVNSTEVDIEDKNITLAFSATTAAQANGGGITINGANATMLYTSSNDSWNFNKAIIGNLTGTASNATFATTAGSTSLMSNGNSNVNIATANGIVSVSVTGTANTVAFGNANTTFNKALVVPAYESTVSTKIEPDAGVTITDSDFPSLPTNITATGPSRISGSLTVTENLSVKGFTETTASTVNTSTSIAPDASTGTIKHYTANANFTFNGFTNAVAGQSMTIVIVQDSTGSRLLTSTMKFVGGQKTLSTAAGAIDLICVVFTGTYYLASLTKGYA